MIAYFVELYLSLTNSNLCLPFFVVSQVAFSLAYILYIVFVVKESQLLPTDVLKDFTMKIQDALEVEFINGVSGRWCVVDGVWW